MKILVATKNSGKFREIVEALGEIPYELLSLKELGILDEVPETGATHEENALAKARYFFEKTGLSTIGEDSGIYVDAFPGELGVHTRRWKGMGESSDAEWIENFLQSMNNVPREKRTAKFVCCSAFVSKSHEKIFRGETNGVITACLEAPLIEGIPLSSCFKHDGANKVYAALSVEEKNRASHRGKAMVQLRGFIDLVL